MERGWETLSFPASDAGVSASVSKGYSARSRVAAAAEHNDQNKQDEEQGATAPAVIKEHLSHLISGLSELSYVKSP